MEKEPVMPEGSFQRLLMESNARKLWCRQENKGFPVIGPFNVFILRMRIRFLENILIVEFALKKQYEVVSDAISP